MVRFQQSFSLHGKARASAALPIWLSENVGLSFEQVGREAIRPGCPTLGSEIHAVVHSSGFVFFESFRFGCLRPFFRLGIARISLGFAFGLTKTSLMLTKINNAMKQYFGLEEKEEFIFTSKAAYMNVNKRGGTFSTKGYDENAVINYAKEYREYILKEIELLTNQREKVTVFVCGGKGYFERLMKALGIEANEFKKYEIQSDNTKVVFVNIAHPSGWISADKLANSMKEG